MISSAEEFVSLRSSSVKSAYDRSAHEEAPVSVWRDVIARYPEYRRWVAHNKTVPLEILEELSQFDARVRYAVAMKRKLSLPLFERLSKDPDSSVRMNIAANKKAPIPILNELMHDMDQDVAKMARNNFQRRSPATR